MLIYTHKGDADVFISFNREVRFPIRFFARVHFFSPAYVLLSLFFHF